jgi:uncharacterized damage-inducible protein DinB
VDAAALVADVVNDDLATFYRLARRTRAGVLDWLATLPSEVLTEARPDFAFGSLDRIYAHVADCYLGWVGTAGLGRADEPAIVAGSVEALRTAFDRVDATVAEALATFEDLDAPWPWTSPEGFQETLSRRWLLLHPITHEFHHKGQALALARVLGHPHPGEPDADLVAPG